MYHILCLGGTVPFLEKRSILSMNQRLVLQRSFAVHCYLNKTTLKELAMQTGLPRRQVSKWFSDERYKTKSGKSEQISSLYSMRIYVDNNKKYKSINEMNTAY